MKIYIKVTTYKRASGKFYTALLSHLDSVHASMDGFQLAELINQNHPSVRRYSGVSSNFSSPDFIHVVVVDYGSGEGFCNFVAGLSS